MGRGSCLSGTRRRTLVSLESAPARVFLKAVWKTPPGMAKRPSTPGDLRDAVERTVQATLGSAERQRERTQGALDDLAGTVDQLRRGAEAGLTPGRGGLQGPRAA